MEKTNAAKHAYCIIAHNEPGILQSLIRCIDDKRNDIFLMIDKKAEINLFKDIKTQHAGLYYAERVNIIWGDVSQIKAELTVFECAFKHGPYKIYHLLSGVDLPIKSQDYIHEFIDMNPNTEFLSFDDANRKAIEIKTRYYHFLIQYARHPVFIIQRIVHYVRIISIKLQQLLGIKRSYPIELHKGANWCSITNALCGYMLSKKSELLTMFKYSFCGDEIFLQSLVWNSEFRDHVANDKGKYNVSLREIDWNRGGPYTWGSALGKSERMNDLKTLQNSSNLFARKFSAKYGWIITEVEKLVSLRVSD